MLVTFAAASMDATVLTTTAITTTTNTAITTIIIIDVHSTHLLTDCVWRRARACQLFAPLFGH